MEKLQQNYEIDIHWHSFELHPAGSPPLPPAYLARIEASRPMLEKMARERYGLEIKAGRLDTDSRPALIAEKFALAHDKGNAFHEAVMHAYWQEERAIDDKEELKALAASVGLDGDACIASLSDPALDEEVSEDVELAHEYGLNGVPALIFENKYLVSGAQPYDLLKQVVEKIQQEEA